MSDLRSLVEADGPRRFRIRILDAGHVEVAARLFAGDHERAKRAAARLLRKLTHPRQDAAQVLGIGVAP